MNAEILKQAELSLAAYAHLDMSVDVKDELKISGFSDAQADKFISRYFLIDQFNDSITGLSSTVFADQDSKETFLTIRGTEGNDLRDLIVSSIYISAGKCSSLAVFKYAIEVSRKGVYFL